MTCSWFDLCAVYREYIFSDSNDFDLGKIKAQVTIWRVLEFWGLLNNKEKEVLWRLDISFIGAILVHYAWSVITLNNWFIINRMLRYCYIFWQSQWNNEIKVLRYILYQVSETLLYYYPIHMKYSQFWVNDSYKIFIINTVL